MGNVWEEIAEAAYLASKNAKKTQPQWAINYNMGPQAYSAGLGAQPPIVPPQSSVAPLGAPVSDGGILGSIMSAYEAISPYQNRGDWVKIPSVLPSLFAGDKSTPPPKQTKASKQGGKAK